MLVHIWRKCNGQNVVNTKSSWNETIDQLRSPTDKRNCISCQWNSAASTFVYCHFNITLQSFFFSLPFNFTLHILNTMYFQSSSKKLSKFPKHILKLFGKCSFSFITPSVWNSLPASLWNLLTPMNSNPSLRLSCLFTDVGAVWLELLVILGAQPCSPHPSGLLHQQTMCSKPLLLMCALCYLHLTLCIKVKEAHRSNSLSYLHLWCVCLLCTNHHIIIFH